jgi:hypothetical protein
VEPAYAITAALLVASSAGVWSGSAQPHADTPVVAWARAADADTADEEYDPVVLDTSGHRRDLGFSSRTFCFIFRSYI